MWEGLEGGKGKRCNYVSLLSKETRNLSLKLKPSLRGTDAEKHLVKVSLNDNFYITEIS